MSIGEERVCEHEGCDVVYVKKTHNQKYHDDECCRLATNAKIMDKYYAKRAQRLGHVRYCELCETTKLSRYNSDSVCNSCSLRREIEKNQAVSEMLTTVLFV